MQLRQTRREERIRVDRQIVNLLSRATYESFPRVLRELISNSYDADATNISIDFDFEASDLAVVDNGNGMNPEQFHYFLTIAATMRTPRQSPRYQRERIGQFGVGFLAAFPFCEEMIVETTAADSPVVITAVIPCATYMKEPEIAVEFSLHAAERAVEGIPVPVSEVSDPRQRRNHYTRITLRRLTSLAHRYFQESTASATKRSVRALPPMERLKWDLQDTVVLDYPPNSAVAAALAQTGVGMEVLLNGQRLFRNEPPGEILNTHKDAGPKEGVKIDGLRVRYAITSPWHPVHPVELRGLRIHVNNVGVGPRQTFGLAVQAGALPRLYWLSGDVYIDKGGREYLALDREGFTNDPSVDALNAHFQSVLRQVEGRLTQADRTLKEVEAELRMPVGGGGPRPKLSVGSKREFVDRHIQELQQSGFTVERIGPQQRVPAREPREATSDVEEESPRTRAPHRVSPVPIEIDRQSRVIRLYEEHPEFKDTLTTTLGEFTLRYDTWDYSASPFPACELSGENEIRVNNGYPLFQSKAYGRFFLRIATTLAVLAKGSPERQEWARDLLLRWVGEFRRHLD